MSQKRTKNYTYPGFGSGPRMDFNPIRKASATPLKGVAVGPKAGNPFPRSKMIKENPFLTQRKSPTDVTILIKND